MRDRARRGLPERIIQGGPDLRIGRIVQKRVMQLSNCLYPAPEPEERDGVVDTNAYMVRVKF